MNIAWTIKVVKPFLFLAVAVIMGFTVCKQAKAENTVSWGLFVDVIMREPALAQTGSDWNLLQLIYQPLVTTDKELKIVPLLAESWSHPSATTYIFNLRKNARFSNGRNLVASDVVDSLNRIIGKKIAGKKAPPSWWAKQLGPVESIEAIDKYKVKVTLKAPHESFLAALAHISAAILPMKEYREGSFDPIKKMMGSGPFMVASHKRHEILTLARNPYYWKENHPKADKILAPIIPDDSSRIAALRNGRIDFATFDTPDMISLVAGDKNIDVFSQKTTNYYRVDFNGLSEKSPFYDVRLRRAANLAIDREAISNILFAGTTSADYPVPSAFGKNACKDVDTYALPRSERLKLARKLIKESGQKILNVELATPSANVILGQIAQIIQQNLENVGFQVKLAQLPGGEFWTKVFVKGKFDFMVSWLAGYTDPTMVVGWWDPEYAMWNKKYLKDVPELSEKLKLMRATPAGSEQDKILVDVCRLIDENANIIALVNRTDYIAYRSDKIHIRFDPVAGSSSLFRYIDEFSPK